MKDIVKETNKNRMEGTLYPVKVGEGGAELVHLLLADALGIPGQDLGLNFVDGSGDGSEEQLPAHTDVLSDQTHHAQSYGIFVH